MIAAHGGNRDALTLAARELNAALARDRSVAVRESGDEVVDTRPFGRLDHLLMRCSWSADEDVFLDALVEEEHVLLDYGEELPQELMAQPYRSLLDEAAG